MLVVDANVLIYAGNSDAVHHAAAREWLDTALGAHEAVGLTWVVMLAYLRLMTSPRVFPTPLPVDEALAQLERWRAAPAATVLHPTARHAGVLAGLLREAPTAGNLVNDAHLAAIALEHGGRIVSFDRDFERFAGVRCLVPG